VDSTLIAWRFLHFIATVQVAGIALYFTFVMRGIAADAGFRRQLLRIFWLSLAIAFVTGVGWALTVAAEIDGSSWAGAWQHGTVGSVLTDTQFGNAWIVRLLAAAMLSVSQSLRQGTFKLVIQPILAIVLVGGLAFAGHGASTPGIAGNIHLAADILHLVAVSAWVGGLLPYAIFLGLNHQTASVDTARRVTRRYSNFAVAAVAMIIATGAVNTLNLVGSPRLMLDTEYGQLLLLKLAIFTIMLIFAAVNRIVLLPRLSRHDIGALRRNALIEFVLGTLVLLIVSIFGTLPPALLDASTYPG
jgi:copper resistance protein D